ncbi:MAG: hypothetical protein MK193_09160 [Lentisphaeria bacterium]|nr:hypothetical protein [Lentisphaeria bacterium]
MQSILAISKISFFEILRQPVFLLILITGLVLISLQPSLALFVFRGQEKLVIDSSLATTLTLGWGLAVLVASQAIYYELKSGTALMILAKPISSSSFILAKLISVTSILILFVWLCGLYTLMALRVATDQFRIDPYINTCMFLVPILSIFYGAIRNYLSKKSFVDHTFYALILLTHLIAIVSFILPEWNNGYNFDKGMGKFHPGVFKEIILILFAVLGLGSLAMALSTRFSMVVNFIVCAHVFMIGLMAEFFFTKLREIPLAEFEAATHFWYYLLLPLAIFFWIFTNKKFAERTNSKAKSSLVQICFLMIVMTILTKGFRDLDQQIQLTEVGVIAKWFALQFYEVRDFVAWLGEAIIPNWQHFWQVDVITKGKTIPSLYIFNCGIYAITYVLLFYLLAVLMFESSEVGTNN